MNSESELIHKAQNGDVAAFEQLVESYQQPVYNLALRMFGNVEDAADIAQEALVKVYLNLAKFKGDSKFSTWIYRVTTNTCLDEIKKRKKLKTYSLSENLETDEGEISRDFEDQSANIEENFERKQRDKIINDAILKLSKNHQTVIIMRDINQLPYDEIAAALKCSEGTVKSRINRARAALYEILKKKDLF